MSDRPTDRNADPQRDRRAQPAPEAHALNAWASQRDATPPDAIALTKDGQRYVFTYHRGHERRVLDEVAQLAADPDCPLDWYDAAEQSHQLGRRLSRRVTELNPPDQTRADAA